MAVKSRKLDKLVSFVEELKFENIPTNVVERAKRHFLDAIGAALAGTTSDAFLKVLRQSCLTEPSFDCLVWGTKYHFSSTVAAFANGVAAHALELDDTGGCDHSGAVVVPSILSLLPVLGRPVSGRELLTAMIVGYEVGRRVLEACGGYAAHNNDGWHSTATCGVFGASAACAKLMGLSGEKLKSAITLSSSACSGLWAFVHDSSQSKKLHAGLASKGGIGAALLAREGMEGPSYLFDDIWGGFLKTYAKDHAESEALYEGLGMIWKLMRCSIKPYASCRGTHSSIDAVIELMEDYGISVDEIKAVKIHLSPFLYNMCGTRDLSSLASAQMSLPYALTAIITLGDAGLNAYQPEYFNSASTKDFMDRIVLKVDDNCDPSREPDVTLDSSDGRSFTTRVDIALGNPRNPMSDKILLSKFEELAGRVLAPEKVAQTILMCLSLEKLDDGKALLDLLQA